MPKTFALPALFVLMMSVSFTVQAQNNYTVSGKVMSAGNGTPIQKATIHLKGSNTSTMSALDGSFTLHSIQAEDTLEVSCVGFEPFIFVIKEAHAGNLIVSLKNHAGALQEVVVGSSRRVPGRSFMQKVIDNKANND